MTGDTSELDRFRQRALVTSTGASTLVENALRNLGKSYGIKGGPW